MGNRLAAGPADAAEALAAAYRGSLDASILPSQRALARQYGLSRHSVASIAAEITAGHSGQIPAPRDPAASPSRAASLPHPD